MRILFCNYEYPPLGGGGGVVMKGLAEELASRSHEVTVLTSQAMDLPSASVENNVNVLRAPVFFRRQKQVANFPSMAAYLPMGLYRAVRQLPRDAFDIINTHFVVPSGPVGHMLRKYFRVPNVLTAHGGDLYDPSKATSPHLHPWLRGVVRWLLDSADGVIGQSRNTLQHIEEIYDVHRPVELIPLGIKQPPRRVQASRAMFGLPEGAFVIATVGRVVARKRTVDLVRAVKECGVPDMHLLVVGDGPERGAVMETANELGIGPQVHCIGEVSERDKFAALSIADMFASTSQHEGFGLVFLEAMAMGLPVVCYDSGGQSDFLATGVTGHLVPLNDIPALSAAIVDLYRHENARARMGRSNSELAPDYFIDRCADRYEEIFYSMADVPQASTGGRSLRELNTWPIHQGSTTRN